MRPIVWHLVTATVVAAGVSATVSSHAPLPVHDSARYVPLDAITRESVARLAPAWTFHSGDFAGGQGPTPRGAVPGLQTRPVVSRGSVYVTTPSSIVIALDAETG